MSNKVIEGYTATCLKIQSTLAFKDLIINNLTDKLLILQEFWLN